MDIKNLANQMNKSSKEAISLRDLALIRSRLSAEKSKFLDVSSLKEGTVLKGEVLDIKQSITTVLTNKGQIFNGKLATDLPINIGENREFIVTNKNGNATLSLLDKPQSEIQSEKVLNTLKELGLKPDSKNLEIANKLIANKMPINKESIQQVKSGMYFIQNSSDKSNSLDKSLFLSKNNILPTKDNIQTLNNINSKDNTITKNLTDIFQKINNNSFPNKELQTQLKQIFKPLEDALNQQKLVGKQEVANKQAMNNQQVTSGENNTITQKENSINKNTQEHLLNKADVKNTEDTKNHIQKNGVLDNAKQTESFLNNKNIKINNKTLEQILDNNKNEVSAQSKEAEVLDKDFKSKNIFELKSNPKEVEEDLNNLKSKLDNALKTLEKSGNESTNGLKDDIKALSNKLDFYNDTKNNTFLQIPLTMNGEQREATINVFNDKKTKKSNDDYITALVSIFTDNLGLFGTYIQKDKRKLNLQFRLENKETEILVQQNINTLKALLKPLNYTIETISFKDISMDEKKNNIEILEKDILELSDDAMPIIFDKKG